MFGIASRTVGHRAGVCAAVAWAFFPWFSKWGVTWVYETTMSALLAALLLWYALYVAETSSRKTWLGFGALWGFALLVNPALLTLFVVALVWCWHARGKARRSAPLVLCFVACLAVMSPWIVRNRVVLGHWVFVRSNFGAEFALGNYHGSLGRGESVGRHPTTNPEEFRLYRDMGEIAYNRWKAQQALNFIWHYPGEFARLTAKRLLYFWDGSAMRFRPPTAWYWMPWSFLPLSVLAVPALWMAYRRRVHGWGLFVGAFLLYPAPYYVVFSLVRYRHVLEPLLLLLLTYAVLEALKPWFPNLRPAQPPAEG
jgi:4-amino-4-deoxy-L-arabinose transferase-like glycosyltransferase